jgi:hypothetical protein
VAKKFNKGRQQKRNIDKQKLGKYREEIARELGVDLLGNKRKNESGAAKATMPAFTFDDDAPLL